MEFLTSIAQAMALAARLYLTSPDVDGSDPLCDLTRYHTKEIVMVFEDNSFTAMSVCSEYITGNENMAFIIHFDPDTYELETAITSVPDIEWTTPIIHRPVVD